VTASAGVITVQAHEFVEEKRSTQLCLSRIEATTEPLL
jgi:hypothetical protein